MGPHEEGSLNIVMLLLSGRATPYLHNGVIYVGDEDHYVSAGVTDQSIVFEIEHSLVGIATIRYTSPCCCRIIDT